MNFHVHQVISRYLVFYVFRKIKIGPPDQLLIYATQEQSMCLGTFSRLRRSLATSTLYAEVCILAEGFLLYRNTISCKAKNCP